MAKFLYEIKQDKSSREKVANLWFAHAKHVETLDNRAMANHIAEHGSIYTPDVIFGVLEKYKTCIVEMLLSSRKVKINGLGTFYTTIEGTGAESYSKFDVKKNIQGVHIRFLPELEKTLSLASTEFVKKVTFKNAAEIGTTAPETPVTDPL
ncbi:MAG: hypothetical protein IJ604_05265 [Prevotella sp.]|nr:hypothetical protein [Prevotella sp.]MBR1462773.1 hypothetical protein [Prevotella sp.]